MRRKDRQRDEEFALEVIDKSSFVTLALWDMEKTYSIPLSMVRKDRSIYFHCAKEGRKLEIIEVNPYVSLSFCSFNEVPRNKKGPLLSHVFTTEYKSAMAEGHVVEVKDEEEKKEALWLLCRKYAPERTEEIQEAIEIGLSYTAVYRIDMTNITGKEKKLEA